MTNNREQDAVLDAALAQWGRQDAGDCDAVARIVEHAIAITASSSQTQASRPAPSNSSRRWRSFAMGGGAIAASIAIALMVMPGAGAPTGVSAGISTDAPKDQGRTELAAADREVDSFAMLFTLTAEEEQFL